MKRIFGGVINGLAILGVVYCAGASGAEHLLSGYATAGINPTVVFIVTDQNNNSVQGIPITITCTAGSLDYTSGMTLADGTFTVRQSDGNLGDQITATCTQVTVGSPYTITTANAIPRFNTDTVNVWFDESRHIINAVVVTTGIGVLTTTSNFDFARSDQTGSNYRDLTVHFYNDIQQTTTTPAQMEVFQGTYASGDYIRVDETVVSGYNGYIYFSSAQPGKFLNAYAVDADSPTVCAVVTNYDGIGQAGVTVTASASSGVMLPASGLTDESGMIFFYQQVGTLGDTITLTCPTQPETSPVVITTAASQARQTSDRLFTWFGKKNRKVYTAIVTRSNNVLVTSALAFVDSLFDANNNYIDPELAAFKPQTSMKPAEGFMTYGSTEQNDVLRFYNNDTSAIYRSGNYHAIIVFPAQESKYLMAFAAGGMNPTVWAVVTDDTGSALKGEPITFSMEGPGALAWSSATTSWGGVTKTAVSGATSIGNTITVSSPGLGITTIFTSDSQVMSAYDKAIGWYDPETHKVYCAFVDSVAQVMIAPGTYIDDRHLVDITSNNNILSNGISISYFSDQTASMPSVAYLGMGTVGEGDIIRLDENNTYANYDIVIVTTSDPDYFLYAFASGGVDPKVYAVVTDKYGKGIKDVPVTFNAATGSMTPGSTVAGFGGLVISDHSSGMLGNVITVSSPGLPPVEVTTSDYAAGVGLEQAITWYDASRSVIWGIIVTNDTKVGVNATDGSYYDPIVADQTDNDKIFSFNHPVNHDFNRPIYPLAQWVIAQGTAGIGDQLISRMGHSTPGSDAFITINEIKSSFLKAFATTTVDPTVTALVVDADGVGIGGVPISFSSSNVSATMSGGPSWVTKFDGIVTSTESGGASQDIITVSAAGYPDVQIRTNYGVGGVLAESSAIGWYAAENHKLTTAVVRYPCYNILTNSVPTTEYVVQNPDQTPLNNRDIAISGVKADALPIYAYVAPGTNGNGDIVSVQVSGNYATEDISVVLPEDEALNLRAFATGGINPTVWVVVTDENGNGISGINIHFQAPVSTAMSVTDTATDDAGVAISVQQGGADGNDIYMSAEGVANTVTVKSAVALNIRTSTRAITWYGVIDRMARCAFVNVPENVMALLSNTTFTGTDRTPNGRTFALLPPYSQQTATEPACVTVSAGSEGEGDQIWITEPTAGANPDAILTLSVPTAGIVSSITASPGTVSVGQNITVAMPVFNNGSPTALTVTPSALNVAGGATYSAGPTPGVHYVIAGGTSENFEWTYIASAPGNVFFNGQAFGIDSFSMLPMTSTATDSNTVIVQTPAALTCNISGPDNVERLCDFTLSMTVNNTGEAAAQNVTPSSLVWTSGGTPAGVSITSGPSPSGADIPGSQNQVFTWTCAAGEQVGTLVFNGSAQGWDSNSGNTVTANSADSNTINVLQGALNLDRISSPDTQVYQGQAGLEVSMYARNTSLMHVTLTASGLNFNGSQQGFVALPAADNPSTVAPESSFELKFIIAINKDAPLGNVVIDGTVSGDAETGAMSANGAQVTASWEILEPFNSLRQNYPNPLRLAQNDCTTFEYFIREDVDLSIKIYNLAGELVAILYEGRPGVGKHTVEWYGDNGEPGQRGQTVGSGVYLAVFKIGDYQETKKVVVIR